MTTLKGKKVTVMGLGLHGGGAAVVKWLVKHGAKVTVTDLKTKNELASSLKKLRRLQVNYVLGRHRESDFKNADLVVQNPGVPRESKYLKIAKKSGVSIENDASLFFKNCPAPIIGVTGTRGKSTTASLIYQLLRQKSDIRNQISGRVWLAGLSQQPMLEILDQIQHNDLVVLELSSWQLEILGQWQLSPKVSVITNIYPDHLNRYRSMVDYIKAKKNIILWQTSDHWSILNLDNPATKKIGQLAATKRLWFSKKEFKAGNGVFIRNKNIYLKLHGQEKKIATINDIKLSGWHNFENVLAAVAVAGVFGVPATAIKSRLKNFKGLPGRLELIRTVDGVKYVNDTTATTPDATIAALRALEQKSENRNQRTEIRDKSKIVLVAGGDSKNIPDEKYQQLVREIKKTCKAVVLFSGRGSDQIIKQLKALKFKPMVSEVISMSKVLGIADSFAKAGDTVLLSPANASFGLFINEFDRGEQFNGRVKEL